MKSSVFSKVMMLTLVLAFATSVFAANDSYKGTFQLSDSTQVNGKQLPAGSYVARWQGTGPSVQVDILSDGKVLMTVPAQVVNLEQAASGNSSEVHSGAGGSRELSVLRFLGKKYSLTLNGQSAQAGMGSGDSAK
jgi:hypothetical protein